MIPDSVWIVYREEYQSHGSNIIKIRGVYATRGLAQQAKYKGYGYRMAQVKLKKRLANGERISLIEGEEVNTGDTVEVTKNGRFKHLYVVGSQNTICGAADRWGKTVPVHNGYALGIEPIDPGKKYHECRKCWK